MNLRTICHRAFCDRCSEIVSPAPRMTEQEATDDQTAHDNIVHEDSDSLPVLIHWEPKWKAPTIRSACPDCGLVADRAASNWTGRVDGTVRVMLACNPIFSLDLECHRTFNETVEAPE